MATAHREPDAPATACRGDGLRLRRILLAVFAVAVGVRAGFVVVRHGGPAAPEPYPDETAYWEVARSLAAGQGLRDEFGFRATYMPAYPAFLSLFERFSRQRLYAGLAQAVLAAAVAPATALLARRLLEWVHSAEADGNARAADRIVIIAAGMAAALDPFLVYFSGLFLTEAVFASLLAAAWAVVVGPPGRACRWREGLIAGLLLLGCVMLRPSAVFLAAAAALVLVLRHGPWRGLGPAAIAVAVIVIGLLPWAQRNQRLLGQRVWLTTRGGISLYDGFRPGADGSSDLAHTKRMPEVQGLNEPAWQDFFRRRAWQAVRDDPRRAVRLAGLKFLRTWSLRPNVQTHRSGPAAAVGAAWTLAVLIAAAAGVIRGRGAPRAVLAVLAPAIAATLVHMVFVGSVRYRVPVMPMLMALGACGLFRAAPRRNDSAGGGAKSEGAIP